MDFTNRYYNIEHRWYNKECSGAMIEELEKLISDIKNSINENNYTVCVNSGVNDNKNKPSYDDNDDSDNNTQYVYSIYDVNIDLLQKAEDLIDDIRSRCI